MSRLSRNRVLVGDALAHLQLLPTRSVDAIVTSPPYYRLRDYQVRGQIGLETTVEDWVAKLHALTREAHRVLVPTGTLWLVLGDSYSTRPGDGAPRKSLLLGPARLALRLVGDGWVLRNTITWAKTNPMPSSVRDRLSATHELIYIFAKQPLYFFDLDAIRVPHRSTPPRQHTARDRAREAWRGPNGDDASGLDAIKAQGRIGHPLGKNPGTVWATPSSNYRGDHHATFPLVLAEQMVRASTPEARCRRCRLPWRRAVIRSLGGLAVRGALAPTCRCGTASEPGLVLDPFLGAGTTALAAETLHRAWLGIELNPAFARLARQRLQRARAGPGKSDRAAAA